MNYVSAIIICLCLVGCSKPEDNSRKATVTGPGSGPESNKPEASKRVNTTNYKVCGSLQGVRTDLRGRWEMTEAQGDNFHFKYTLDIQPNQITLRQDCYLNGARLTPEVSVAASYDSQNLKVLADGNDAKQTTVGSSRYECRTQLVQNQSTYKFVGNCLELTGFQGRPYLLFVPQ